MLGIGVLLYLVLISECVSRWERRTLVCDLDDCTLSMNGNRFEKATCELDRTGKHSCDIKCGKADRDSVISKSPTTNRKCIRYHTYNTERKQDGWYMYRTGACATENIQLEVHCGFPLDDAQ